MKNSQSSTRIVRWGLFLTFAFLLGIAFERGQVEYWLGAQSDLGRAVKKYESALKRVEQNYIEDVSPERLTRTALRAIAEQKLDEHSAYMSPDRYQSFSTGTSGNYVGVGIRVSEHKKTGFIEVVYPFRGSPALKKGVQPGDLITKIEGSSVKNLSLDEAVSRIKGKKGTSVTITIRSDDTERDLTLERQVVDIPTVAQWGLLSTDFGSIGYISVRQFSENTVSAFKGALKRLKKKKIKGLIIDVRMNPGGLLTASIDLADLFLEPNQEIVSVKYRSRDSEVHRSSKQPIWAQGPVAILVNGDSASASEVFAGALQDHEKAVLVGTRTFGKGSVQQVFPFNGDGDAFKMTVARYYTPTGKAIDRAVQKQGAKNNSNSSSSKDSSAHGLKPDYTVPIADAREKRQKRWKKLMDAWQEGKSTKASKQLTLELYQDPQLKKALDVLAKKIQNQDQKQKKTKQATDR